MTAISAATVATLMFSGGTAVASTSPGSVDASKSVDVSVTLGEVYTVLKASDLYAEDKEVDGQVITTFKSDDGMSLAVPRPDQSQSEGFGTQLSGKIKKNGEPVIYLNQKDQKAVKDVGKAAIAGFLALIPAGKVAKFLAGAFGVSVANFIGDKGICSSNRSLRITGTVGGDAIREIKCV